MILFDVGSFNPAPGGESNTDSKEEEKRIYTCIRCGSMITPASSKTNIDGAFKHSFTNPHGYMFTIGCFTEAPGCASAGTITSDFTWFPGFAWRISLCAVCGLHMGWEFSKGTAAFYGLILMNLRERDK